MGNGLGLWWGAVDDVEILFVPLSEVVSLTSQTHVAQVVCGSVKVLWNFLPCMTECVEVMLFALELALHKPCPSRVASNRPAEVLPLASRSSFAHAILDDLWSGLLSASSHVR